MNQLFHKLYYALLVCLVISLPFYFSELKTTSFIIILLILNAIPLYFSAKRDPIPSSNKSILFFALFFFIHFIAIFNSDNTADAWFDIEKKLSLAIFPLLLLVSPKLNDNQVKNIFIAFATSCVLASVYCVAVGISKYETGNSSVLFYHTLSSYVGMHAIYLSIYLCFSMAILIYYYELSAQTLSLLKKLAFFSAIIILTTTIILLSARIAIILLIVGCVAFLTIKLKQRIHLVKAFAFAAAIGGILILIVLLLPKNRERYKEVVNYKGEYTMDKKGSGGAARKYIWLSALELIQEHPTTGVGIGDIVDELSKKYELHQYTFLTEVQDMSFNAHNQYLETTLGLGIVGLIIFLALLLFSLLHAIKHKNVLYFVFVIIFGVSCLTESCLQKQSGIIFYAFFNAFLFTYAERKTSDGTT
jgi:O-antigen ligase